MTLAHWWQRQTCCPSPYCHVRFPIVPVHRGIILPLVLPIPAPAGLRKLHRLPGWSLHCCELQVQDTGDLSDAVGAGDWRRPCLELWWLAFREGKRWLFNRWLIVITLTSFSWQLKIAVWLRKMSPLEWFLRFRMRRSGLRLYLYCLSISFPNQYHISYLC